MDTPTKYSAILKQYKAIFIFMFRYFFLLLGVLGCFLIFNRVFFPSEIAENDPLIMQNTQAVEIFENFLKQAIHNNEIDVFILQGPLVTQNNFIISQDNLLTYRGFVVPRNVILSMKSDIKPISYFEGGKYSSGELTKFLDNFVFTTQENSPPSIKSPEIPIDGGIVKTFNLGCLFHTTILSSSCSYYIKNFLSSFFVYKLSADYAGLQTVYEALKKKESYRKTFCENAKKYVLYTNDTNGTMGLILGDCGEEYYSFFTTMDGFVVDQKLLNNKIVSPDVSRNYMLNAYKLLSYQQLLYQDFENFRIRSNQYVLYLDFIEELLKRGGLPQFYIDELYRYNNEYLKPTLLLARYDNRFPGLKETDISKTIRKINTINIGDKLIGYTGLSLLVSNKDLVSIDKILTPEMISLQDTIAKRIVTIPYITISQSSVSENNISIKGYFIIQDPIDRTATQKTAITINLAYQDDAFLVRDLVLPKYEEFTKSLQAMVRGKNMNIADVYNKFVQDLPLYQTSGTVMNLQTMCSNLRSLETGLAMKVSTCAESALVLTKTRKDATITYTVFLQNFLPSNVIISDPEIQAGVNELIPSLQGKSLKDFVEAVIKYIPEEPIVVDTGGNEGGGNTIFALQAIEKYMRIKPNDVAEKNGKILLDITIKGVNFIAYYVISGQKLEPRYFKDILSNKKPLLIKNLSLTLNDAGLQNIKDFSNDPIAYIKKIDYTAWKNYTNK